MRKNYCDLCGKELESHEGYFISFKKNYSLMFFDYAVISHNKCCFDEDELCETCYYEFLKVYDKFIKSHKK